MHLFFISMALLVSVCVNATASTNSSKHRRATVSLGYIGLYEVASVFYGSDWETNLEAKTFTLNIVKCDEKMLVKVGLTNMTIISLFIQQPSEKFNRSLLSIGY